jgi:MoxR-like ATPase
MVGTFIQKEGNTLWIDGPAVCAMKQGSRIVLDETDHSSPECVSLLYALLDDSPSIVLPTGEQVRAMAGYQVIGTSNSSPADFPEAILDRFEAVIIADEPHPLAVDRVKVDAGPKAGALVGLMTNYYRGLSREGYQFRGNPTLRKCRNYARLLSAGMNEDVAATVIFGKGAKEIISSMTTSGVK